MERLTPFEIDWLDIHRKRRERDAEIMQNVPRRRIITIPQEPQGVVYHCCHRYGCDEVVEKGRPLCDKHRDMPENEWVIDLEERR